jgi:hypothetical protein
MPRPPVIVDTSALRGRNLNVHYAKSVAGSTDVTLTMDEAATGILELTGALTGSINVIFPLNSQNEGEMWFVKNLCTGSPNFTVTVKATGQTGVVVERHELIAVYMNGTDLIRTHSAAMADRITQLSRRFNLKWVAGQRQKPAIAADLQTSTATLSIADPEIEVLGTNATTALCTQHADGGILLTTAGASGDQMILAPHLTSGATAWTGTTWGTDDSTEWECHLKTGANITAVTIWAGLKLTNTPTSATDADQVFFRYQDTVVAGDWQAVSSIATVLTATDSGVAAAVSTEYHLRITIDSSRVARMFVNGAMIVATAALTNTTDFIPYIAVQANTAAAKTLRVFGQAISRAFA